MSQTSAKLSRSGVAYGLTIFAAVCLIYAVGGYSAKHDLPPYSLLHAAKNFMLPPQATPDRYTFDDAKRIIADDRKISLACPQQNERSAVLLIIGQSNAANHQGQRYRSKHGPRIINYLDGQCFIAESPLLGSSGVMGEYWTEVGNLLIESGKFTEVVLVPVASTGSEVARWAKGGDLNKLMLGATTQLQQSGYRVTHVLWHQGEKDYVDGTREDAYTQRFGSLVLSLRSEGVDAPVFVSVASKCLGAANGGTRDHFPDNEVTRAQRALPNGKLGITSGVDTDSLLDELDRVDDCHFGATGQQKVAQAWADLLLERGKSASLP